MHDTPDHRRVLLVWYWPCALGTHIHCGYGLSRLRVLASLGAALSTTVLVEILLLAGDRDSAALLAVLSCGRHARGWYLLDAYGSPTRYLSATKPHALAGQRATGMERLASDLRQTPTPAHGHYRALRAALAQRARGKALPALVPSKIGKQL